MFFPVRRRVPKVIPITPIACLHQLSEIPCSPEPVIRDPSYSESQMECSPRVWYSPEIDTSKFTLNILPDIAGGFQRLKYMVLMWVCRQETWGNMGMPVTSLGTPRITSEQLGCNIFFANTAAVPQNHSYFSLFNNFKTHVFNLYSHLWIHIATHVHTVYLDRLLPVLESNWRCARQWGWNELTDTL